MGTGYSTEQGEEGATITSEDGHVTTTNTYERERAVAVHAVLAACKVCQAVFRTHVTEDTLSRRDRSPVTVADFSAQALVNHLITQQFPNDRIVGEEDATALRTEGGRALLEKVINMTNSVLAEQDHLPQDTILNAIDVGVDGGGAVGRHWALDPLDGTLGFLRGEQFAVGLALVENGQVVVGVLGCPNLLLSLEDPEQGRGCLLVAVRGAGAYIRTLEDPTETKISVTDIETASQAAFTESVEAGHSDHSQASEIMSILGVTIPSIRMDSQCKYATVARGDASIYLRLPTLKGYEEKIWDHAGGHLIVKEAGGEVTDVTGKPLDFSIGRTLKSNTGVVATNGRLHREVIAAVQSVLNPPTYSFEVAIKGHTTTSDAIKGAIIAATGVNASLITVEHRTGNPDTPLSP
eukprot:TRINITY_DN533_c1_g2_i1.p1 TRINITY_DN533_c1_g2~~TRINITY_DN533_c1_g2_i1.p1  ORF type:complete len:443 (-),score=136.60 TRINITY_DN533_c1_g2_i1:165-1388(-)